MLQLKTEWTINNAKETVLEKSLISFADIQPARRLPHQIWNIKRKHAVVSLQDVCYTYFRWNFAMSGVNRIFLSTTKLIALSFLVFFVK